MRDTPIAGKLVVSKFKEREELALKAIINSGIEFIELGFFGSYARNEYKATSDIDTLVITNTRPSREGSGELRAELDSLGVDLVYMSIDYFTNSKSNFACKVRKDYIRRLTYEERVLC